MGFVAGVIGCIDGCVEIEGLFVLLLAGCQRQNGWALGLIVRQVGGLLGFQRFGLRVRTCLTKPFGLGSHLGFGLLRRWAAFQPKMMAEQNDADATTEEPPSGHGARTVELPWAICHPYLSAQQPAIATLRSGRFAGAVPMGLNWLRRSPRPGPVSARQPRFVARLC